VETVGSAVSNGAIRIDFWNPALSGAAAPGPRIAGFNVYLYQGAQIPFYLEQARFFGFHTWRISRGFDQGLWGEILKKRSCKRAQFLPPKFQGNSFAGKMPALQTSA